MFSFGYLCAKSPQHTQSAARCGHLLRANVDKITRPARRATWVRLDCEIGPGDAGGGALSERQVGKEMGLWPYSHLREQLRFWKRVSDADLCDAMQLATGGRLATRRGWAPGERALGRPMARRFGHHSFKKKAALALQPPARPAIYFEAIRLTWPLFGSRLGEAARRTGALRCAGRKAMNG